MLERAVLDYDIDQLVHLVAAHAVPADVKLDEVAGVLDHLAEFAEVGLVDVDIDQTETADVVLRPVEAVQQIVCHFRRHLAVLEVETAERVPHLAFEDDGKQGLQGFRTKRIMLV